LGYFKPVINLADRQFESEKATVGILSEVITSVRQSGKKNPARVKVVVASFMQPTAVYLDDPNAQ